MDDIKKKLSYNIKRIYFKHDYCFYNYEFKSRQWLESVDNYEYFGIEHNEIKEKHIESLVSEFRIALNNVVFGDPAGRAYVEYLKNNNENEKI